MLRLVRFTNPLIIGMAYSLLNLFKNRKVVYRGVLCKVSNLSLLIYLIHNNWLFKNYCLVSFWKYIYSNFSYKFVSIISIGLATTLFICATIIAFIYTKTLGKYTKHLSGLLYKQCNKVIEKI